MKIIGLLCLWLLSGCQHQWSNPEQKTCLNACYEKNRYCHKICQTDCPHCCKYTKMQGLHFYRRYLKRCRIEGKPAFSSLQSFYDPLQCNKNSCDCQKDFLLCQQSCHGKIPKRLKTYKFC